LLIPVGTATLIWLESSAQLLNVVHSICPHGQNEVLLLSNSNTASHLGMIGWIWGLGILPIDIPDAACQGNDGAQSKRLIAVAA
jgi:hypothetical protein